MRVIILVKMKVRSRVRVKVKISGLDNEAKMGSVWGNRVRVRVLGLKGKRMGK